MNRVGISVEASVLVGVTVEVVVTTDGTVNMSPEVEDSEASLQHAEVVHETDADARCLVQVIPDDRHNAPADEVTAAEMNGAGKVVHWLHDSED